MLSAALVQLLLLIGNKRLDMGQRAKVKERLLENQTDDLNVSALSQALKIHCMQILPQRSCLQCLRKHDAADMFVWWHLFVYL